MMLSQEKTRADMGSPSNPREKAGRWRRWGDGGVSVLDHSYQHSHPLRTLYLLFAGSRVRLAGAIALAVVADSVLWIMPIVSAGVINVLSSPQTRSFGELVIYVTIGIIVVAQNVPLCIWYQSLVSRRARQMESRLRGALIRRLQQLSIRFHDDSQSGRLQSKILRDVEAVHAVSKLLIIHLTVNVSLLAIILVITLIKQPLIAGFFLVTIPLAAMLLRFFRSRITQKNKEFQAWFKNDGFWVTVAVVRAATVGRWAALEWVVAGLAEISCVGSVQSPAVPANADVAVR